MNILLLGTESEIGSFTKSAKAQYAGIQKYGEVTVHLFKRNINIKEENEFEEKNEEVTFWHVGAPLNELDRFDHVFDNLNMAIYLSNKDGDDQLGKRADLACLPENLIPEFFDKNSDGNPIEFIKIKIKEYHQSSEHTEQVNPEQVNPEQVNPEQVSIAANSNSLFSAPTTPSKQPEQNISRSELKSIYFSLR